MPAQRYGSIVDVHVILRRDGKVKHSELVWADPARLPPDTVGYTAAVITAVEQGLTFTLNGW